MIICRTCENNIDFCDCLFNDDPEHSLFQLFNFDDKSIPSIIDVSECDLIWHPTVENALTVKPQVFVGSQIPIDDFEPSRRYSFHKENELLTGDPTIDDPSDKFWPHVQYTRSFLLGTKYFSAEVAIGFPDGSVKFTVLYFEDLPLVSDVQNAIKTGQYDFVWNTWQERNEAEASGEMNQGLRGNRLGDDLSSVLSPPPPNYLIDYGDYPEEEFDGELDEDLLPNLQKPDVDPPDSIAVGRFKIKPNITRRYGVFTGNWKYIGDEDLKQDPYCFIDLPTNFPAVDYQTFDHLSNYIEVATDSTTRECEFFVLSCNPFLFQTPSVFVKFLPVGDIPPGCQVEVNGIVYPYNEEFTVEIQHYNYGFENLRLFFKSLSSPPSSFRYRVEVTGYWDENIKPYYVTPRTEGWTTTLEQGLLDFEFDGTYSPSKFQNAGKTAYFYTEKIQTEPPGAFFLRGECVCNDLAIRGFPLGNSGCAPVVIDPEPEFSDEIFTNELKRLPGSLSAVLGSIKYNIVE